MKTLKQTDCRILKSGNHRLAMLMNINVGIQWRTRFLGGKLAVSSCNCINHVIHWLPSRLALIGIKMRHHAITEMLKPAMNALRSFRHKIDGQLADSIATLERSHVVSMDGQREGLKQRVRIRGAMLRDKLTRPNSLLHGGDGIAKQPPPLAFVYRGFFHFLHNVKVMAPPRRSLN